MRWLTQGEPSHMRTQTLVPTPFPTRMSKRMMKSVSSMRSAGVRHVVGGYRGGSKLHKAATPTLATRNFRGKFE